MSPYIFCSPQGKFLHNFERYWRPALEVAKIPDFRTDGTSGNVADAETPEKIGAPGGNRTPDPRLRSGSEESVTDPSQVPPSDI